MLGMLEATLVVRRFDQNPLSMVTACTGTLFNLAYGELRVAMIPAFAQSRSRSGVPAAPVVCRANPGKAIAAVAAAVVDMNWRRVGFLTMSMGPPLPNPGWLV